MNAKEQLDFVRDLIGEGTAAHWTDVGLVRRLNMAQERIALRIAMTAGQWLVKSASVTPSSSIITLPSDCSKPVYLEETSSGEPIDWLGSVTHRRVSRGIGAAVESGALEAYPLQGTIEVNRASYSTACTLWYQRRTPRLHAGTAATGTGENALTFAADLNLVMLDDYYNGVTVEVIDQTSGIVDIRSAISDYIVSTHTAVVVGTGAVGDTYGTISVLPEETHLLMCYMAAADAALKPGATLDEKTVDRIRADKNDLMRDVWQWLESRIVGGERVQIGEEY